MNIARNSTGSYTVNFVGLGGRTTAGGNVQITAYGGGNEVCKVVGWGSGGADFVVTVRCFFASNGANTDTLFDILVGWFGQ